MLQLFLMVDSGEIRLIETPVPIVKENTVIVETQYSAVSAGTERSLTSFGKKNLINKAIERPDQVKKVLDKMAVDGVLTTMRATVNRLGEPMPLGYSGVGTVVACGKNVTKVMPGDTVAMLGQAYHSEVNRVSNNLIAKVPVSIMDIRQCAFGALAGIALQGIHQANVQPGETVAVIGLGLLGHICTRLLSAYGCDVIVFDITDKTMPGTRCKAFIQSADENAVEKVLALTKGYGVDKVIITAAADSNQPMDLAASIVRDRGTICMVGVTQMEIDRRPYYEKELTFTIARSYGPGRYDDSYEEKAVDYPIGQVRFTEGRNLEEFLRLIEANRLDLTDLITHEYPYEKATEAYELITDNPNHEKVIGVLLQYPPRDEKWTNTIVRKKTTDNMVSGAIHLGLIGAGNFAKNIILPTMKSVGGFVFHGLATTGGSNAAQAGSTADFHYITNDYKELLQDKNIHLIAISTRHDSHAKFVMEALQAGKSVYCEKPLCLTLDELKKVRQAYEDSPGELFCGLNRRYAPLIRQIKKEKGETPSIYNYIVNAGAIPENHWTQDEAAGGGRIIGEACHFVDTLQYLDGSELTGIDVAYAHSDAYPKKDNAVLTLTFASGSMGSIVYTAMGSKKYPKEQLSVFANGMVWNMDNFIRLRCYGAVGKTVRKLEQDKGVAEEYKLMQRVLQGQSTNDAIVDAFAGHKILLAAINHCKEQ